MQIFFSAAGLLLLLVLSILPVLATPSFDLRSSFKARALAKHRHGHYHQTFTKKAPLRYRSRRRQVKIIAKTNDGSQLQPTPPRMVHPNRFEQIDTSHHEYKNLTLDEANDTTFSIFPLWEASDTTHVVRGGKTGALSSRTRSINTALQQDTESKGVSDANGVLEFNVLSLSPGKSQNLPKSDVFTYGTSLDPTEASTFDDLVKRDGFQNILETLIKSPQNETSRAGLKAASTWSSQPSSLRPKTPYEPDMNSTHGYGDALSKSLWFYQVQRTFPAILFFTPLRILGRERTAHVGAAPHSLA